MSYIYIACVHKVHGIQVHVYVCVSSVSCVYSEVKCERLFFENKTEDDGQSIYGQCYSSIAVLWQVGRFDRVRRSFTYCSARCDNRRTYTPRTWPYMVTYASTCFNIFTYYFHTCSAAVRQQYPVKFPFAIFQIYIMKHQTRCFFL